MKLTHVIDDSSILGDKVDMLQETEEWQNAKAIARCTKAIFFLL